MQKNILLLGNGGREHALAEAILCSPQENVYLYGFFSANNPAISELCAEFFICDQKNFGEEDGFASLKKFAQENAISLAVLGPDDPIAAGAADALREVGIESFGPTKKCAQLESSKGFTRSLLQKYEIPGNPEFQRFTAEKKSQMRDYLESLSHKFVIKDDGLCGGKGVFVQDDHFQSVEEGIEIAEKVLDKSGELVIEEKLEGPEFSLMFFADGNSIAAMPTIADHKRAFENDEGPNTGGMGTISFPEHLPFITQKNVDQATEITEKVMKAVEKETGEKFHGVMYGGFMRTKNGTKLIEYNARFGDPEALNALPLLETDFIEIIEAIAEERLSEVDVKFMPLSTVCKYLVPNGYPTNSVKGEEVIVDWEKIDEDTEVFFASVKEENEKLVLCGSRAIGVVGVAETYEKAAEKANAALEAFSGPLFSRKDIGTNQLLEKRMDMVKGMED